jgi:uncharacterized protein (DUF362 family)/NAD-dependent dihydropyrimidine dehydrogenase PreA subunit
MSSKVVLRRCGSYEPTEVDRAIQEVLRELEPLPFKSGCRVLLKPNLLSASSGPEHPVNTRAEVVAACGRYLKTHHDARLVIADSGGIGSYGRTDQAYRTMGLVEVAQELGAELLNLETLGLATLESPVGKVLAGFQATALLNRIDAIVNIPKLKTHLLTGLTGAVKNCLGLLPGSLKRDVHVVAPTGPMISQALVDIYAAVKPLLHVMDGVTAMEGAGPSQGQSRHVGWLLGAKDGVALDMVASRMIGLKPHYVPTLAASAAAGLGGLDVDHVEPVGAEWSEIPVSGFRGPYSRTMSALFRVTPTGLTGRILKFFLESKPRIRRGKCQGCGLCVAACPANALTLVDRDLSLDPGKCIECYCCLEHCPNEGIGAPKGFWDRLLGGS